MPVGDVWILGAGASAEAGVPVISDFKRFAEWIRHDIVEYPLDERERSAAMGEVLGFWNKHLPSFNIEELFGYLESPGLASVTGVSDVEVGKLRHLALFLIAETINHALHEGISAAHLRFVNHLEDWVPVITFNWDISLENAILSHGCKVTYVLPKTPDWDPNEAGRAARKVLKLHGSLNWVLCGSCDRVTFFAEISSVTDFILASRGTQCAWCGSEERLEVLLVPPVLSKLTAEHSKLQSVWRDAFQVLQEANRVFIVGYSFPPTDVQTRLFICKALRQAKNLRKLVVITRPKFGTEKAQFEDRYVKALAGSQQETNLEFMYSAFGRINFEDIDRTGR